MIIKNNIYGKKGAVEMSLNLIIMLVIGLTVLGLIIAFVTGFLGDATEGIGGSLPGDEERLQEVLSRSGNFEFLRSSMTVQRNSNARMFVKFENPLTDEATIFTGQGFIDQDSAEDDNNIFYTITGGPNPEELSAVQSGITIAAPPITLNPSQANSFPMDLRISSGVPTGNYFLSFRVTFGDEEGDERSYTQVVTLTVN